MWKPTLFCPSENRESYLFFPSNGRGKPHFLFPSEEIWKTPSPPPPPCAVKVLDAALALLLLLLCAGVAVTVDAE